MAHIGNYSTRNGGAGLYMAIISVLTFAVFIAAPRLSYAQTFSVLHTFTGGADGAIPTQQLRMDRAGNLYGVAGAGGNQGPNCETYGCGVAFKLTHRGSAWTFSTLYSFHGGSDGGGPDAPLVQGPDGALYSATTYGGIGTCSSGSIPNCGVIYRLAPPGAFCKSFQCEWSESVLYAFAGYSDGGYPGHIQFDQAGDIYGTTSLGERGRCNNCGTVFELSPSNGGWVDNVLYAFKSGSGDGNGPEGDLVFDQAGNIYGTTAEGGVTYDGTVYQLTPSQSGWKETMLYEFQSAYSGDNPIGLIIDADGNLYGTTGYGGGGDGCGTVFQMSLSQGMWGLSILDNIPGGSECYGPNSGLIMDGAGNLYGTTIRTGAYRRGVVFKLTPSGNGWTYSTLHDFTGGSDGFYPEALYLGADGNLYGVAAFGAGPNCGGQGCGVVFEITQ